MWIHVITYKGNVYSPFVLNYQSDTKFLTLETLVTVNTKCCIYAGVLNLHRHSRTSVVDGIQKGPSTSL